MSKRTRAFAGSYDSVVEALNSFQGQLLCSSAKVSSTGQGRYAPDAIDIEPDTWKNHWSAVKQDPRFTRVGKETMSAGGLFKGGAWFYWAKAPDNLVYTGGFEGNIGYLDVGAMLGVARPLPAPKTRRQEYLQTKKGKGVEYSYEDNTAPVEDDAVDEDSSSDEEEDPEVAALTMETPRAPAKPRPYSAPPLESRIGLSLELLSRPKRMRTSTPDLKKRTGLADERGLRLDATVEALAELNKVDASNKREFARLLLAVAEHADVMVELSTLIGAQNYLTARDLLSYKYMLKLRMSRMEPMVRDLNKRKTSCSVAEFHDFYESMPYVEPVPLDVDLDQGAARLVPYDKGQKQLLESRAAHELNMFNFSFKKDDKPYILDSFGADKCKANSTTSIELALWRSHNLQRHVNAPHAAQIAYMGAHGETLPELHGWMPEVSKKLEAADREGVRFRCQGRGICNACARRRRKHRNFNARGA
ncbi:hypothetical protein JL720_6882 [Aureococcus anophagefferens]|nr:hypothetical protein JL720_6882 [Aureococcus anophagefferens]